MTDSLPLYRIIYADGYVGAPRPWHWMREVWDRQLAQFSSRLAPVRVERAR